tara:strand:- start:233 stop:850 length:618 start_codon:yes stop_codon:yes gene_type:complete
MEKYCKKCNQYKQFNQYHKHKKGQFGLYPICKLCRKNSNINQINNFDLINTEFKTCNSCNLKLNSDKFYKNKNTKSGLTPSCKKCYLENRSINQSKVENYMRIILGKFKKNHQVNFNELELIRCYNNQDKKCFISNHTMSHLVDTKGRSDNIFNASIIPINKKDIYEIDDIKLGINLFYSVGKIYNLSTDKVLVLYEELTNLTNN